MWLRAEVGEGKGQRASVEVGKTMGCSMMVASHANYGDIGNERSKHLSRKKMDMYGLGFSIQQATLSYKLYYIFLQNKRKRRMKIERTCQKI